MHLKFLEVRENYFQVVESLGYELENKFYRLDQFEACLLFNSKPFMKVEIPSTVEQLITRFSLNAEETEIEIIILQNDFQLKAYHGAPNFWSLVDTRKY